MTARNYEDRIRSTTDRILIRDITPTTPCGLSPKVVAGDETPVTAVLVADGHDILSADVVVWRVDSPDNVMRVAMEVDPHGHAVATIGLATVGTYRFRIDARRDQFATWKRDLVVREAAGEDLTGEFAQGAELLDRIRAQPMEDVTMAQMTVLSSAISTLRSSTCSHATKMRAALDEELAELTEAFTDESQTTSSDMHPIRVDRELAVFGAWYELFPRSEGDRRAHV